MKRLWFLGLVFALSVGVRAAADQPPGDYEEIIRACVCSCLMPTAPYPVRYRLPGGGFGVEYRSGQFLQSARTDDILTYDFKIRGITSAQRCATMDGRLCQGYLNGPDAADGILSSGNLYRCRYRPVPSWL